MATKSRAFTGIVYPDSAPEDWQKALKESLGMWLISPLHSPDDVEDVETGAIKTLKQHYHVMYYHGSPITAKSARGMLSRYPWIVVPKGDTFFQVTSVRNLSRYFLHLDQDDKEKFAGKPEEQLTVLNGFPLDLERELTRADKRKIKRAVFEHIRNEGITEYSELVDWLMSEMEWEKFDYVTERSVAIQHYLMSRRKSEEFKQNELARMAQFATAEDEEGDAAEDDEGVAEDGLSDDCMPDGWQLEN